MCACTCMCQHRLLLYGKYVDVVMLTPHIQYIKFHVCSPHMAGAVAWRHMAGAVAWRHMAGAVAWRHMAGAVAWRHMAGAVA